MSARTSPAPRVLDGADADAVKQRRMAYKRGWDDCLAALAANRDVLDQGALAGVLGLYSDEELRTWAHAPADTQSERTGATDFRTWHLARGVRFARRGA